MNGDEGPGSPETAADAPLWPHPLMAGRPHWPAWLRVYDRVIGAVIAAQSVIAIIGFLVVLVVVAAGVFCRYVLNAPLTWAETVGLWALVWTVFIGAPGPLAAGTHYVVESFIVKLPLRLQRTAALLTLALSLWFSVVITIEGAWLTWQNLSQIDPATGQPYAISYLAIPLAFAAMSAVLLRDILVLILRPAPREVRG